MPLILRALFDPPLNQVALLRRQLLVRLRRRHLLVGIGAQDAHPRIAARQIPRLDRRHAVLIRPVCALLRIQPQLRLALLRIEAMACETVVRKNRADIAIEHHGLRGMSRGEGDEKEEAEGGAHRG